MKHLFRSLFLLLLLALPSLTLAQLGGFGVGDEEAGGGTSVVGDLAAEYEHFGLEPEDASSRAENAVNSLVSSMKSDQNDVASTYESLKNQVHGLPTQGERREAAVDALEDGDNNAKDAVENFTGFDAAQHVVVVPSVAGSPPYVEADEAFQAAHNAANEAISNVRRVLINPSRPGSVPAGDIVSDFIPQIIRQLYRFAWVGILIALTVSGVMFVTAQENDERLTKARGMLYYTLIGFAFIAFSFAIVKALTDIDFFRFI